MTILVGIGNYGRELPYPQGATMDRQPSKAEQKRIDQSKASDQTVDELQAARETDEQREARRLKEAQGN